MATPFVSRISRRLVFFADSTGKLQEFLLATPHPTVDFPFSKFQFNLHKLTKMEASLLQELVERHGKHVRELRFLKQTGQGKSFTVLMLSAYQSSFQAHQTWNVWNWMFMTTDSLGQWNLFCLASCSIWNDWNDLLWAVGKEIHSWKR